MVSKSPSSLQVEPGLESDAESSASVHWYQIKSWRQFWVKQKRIALLLCQAKGNTAGSCPEKLCVPTWEDLMRSFIAIVQGWGC